MRKTLDALLKQFANVATEQNEALLRGKLHKVNPLARKMDATFRQIAEYGDEGRKSLLAMTNDSNLAAAEMAAVYSLQYDTPKSLVALKRLSREPGHIGLSAKQAMQRWNEGDLRFE